ncbi:MAG: hypothetical protein KDE48_22180 [Anaerolineales bacterium]|nr:hypothetical protein [Anaerolineales bacterium]
MSKLEKVIGPRIPEDAPKEERRRFMLPKIIFIAAAVILLLSVFFPYWEMTLLAPQYPKGLHITAYVNRLTGDVFEIDGLNHYIGMRPLDEAAQFEKSVSVIAIVSLSIFILLSIFVHNKWIVLLTLPAILMPLLFLADLQFWLRDFGLNLDESAPLSAAIKPFVPSVLGRGVIAQFETVASPGIGLYMSILSSILIIIGLYFHRKAYKPLVDSMADQHNAAAE